MIILDEEQSKEYKAFLLKEGWLPWSRTSLEEVKKKFESYLKDDTQG